MPPGFSGNLIFAIIARMLCGNHLNNRFKSVESSEIEEETFRDTLPEGYTYNIEEISGDEGSGWNP